MRLLNGDLEQKWTKHGLLHNEDGPAYMVKSGISEEVLVEEYYLLGEKVPGPSNQATIQEDEDTGFSWGALGGAIAVAGLTSMLAGNKQKTVVRKEKEELITIESL